MCGVLVSDAGFGIFPEPLTASDGRDCSGLPARLVGVGSYAACTELGSLSGSSQRGSAAPGLESPGNRNRDAEEAPSHV